MLSNEPPLSLNSVSEHWKDYSKAMHAFILAIEPFENWTLDRKDSVIDRVLCQLSEQDLSLPESSLESFDADDLADILSRLSFGRSLRLLKIFSSIKPEWLLDFIAYCEHQDDHPECNVIVKRILLLQQFNFLETIFSPSRLEMVELSLHEVLDEAI